MRRDPVGYPGRGGGSGNPVIARDLVIGKSKTIHHKGHKGTQRKIGKANPYY